MPLIAKVESNSVVMYMVPNNVRKLKITGWPDAERVTSAICSESVVNVTFNNGKVRAYNAETGQYLGTF